MLATLRTIGLLRPLSVAALVLLAMMLGFWALGLAVPLDGRFALLVFGSVTLLIRFNLILNILLLFLSLAVLASSYKLPWGAALQSAFQGLLVWGASAAYHLVERLISSPIAF